MSARRLKKACHSGGSLCATLFFSEEAPKNGVFRPT